MITKIINKILSKLGIKIIPLGEFDCIRDKAREQLEDSEVKIGMVLKQIKILEQEKQDLTVELNTLKTKHHYDMVTLVHRDCYFKDEEARKRSINAMIKADMSIQDIDICLEPLREFRKARQQGTTTTKLPQRINCTRE